MTDEFKKGRDPWSPGLPEEEEVSGPDLALPSFDDRDFGNLTAHVFHHPGVAARIRVDHVLDTNTAKCRILAALEHPYAQHYLKKCGFEWINEVHLTEFCFFADGVGGVQKSGVTFKEGWREFIETLLKIRQANSHVAQRFSRNYVTILMETTHE